MKYIFWVLIGLVFLTYCVNANNSLSDWFETKSQCIEEKMTQDTQFPDYTRSECFQVTNKFYYNICQTQYCPIPSRYAHEWSVENMKQIEKFTSLLENKLEKLEAKKVEPWSNNFLKVLEKLETKYKYNKQSLTLLQDVQTEFTKISEKQMQQNALCASSYGKWWQEAAEYINTDNTVDWYIWEKKTTLMCQYYPDTLKIGSMFDWENQQDKWVILLQSKLTNYLNKIILEVEFSDNIWENKILLRNYSTYHYQEKYLGDYNKWNYKKKTFHFSDVARNATSISYVNGEEYTLEIYDETNDIIMAQYKFIYSDESKNYEIPPAYPVLNSFDGNKDRSENYHLYLTEISKEAVHDFFDNIEKQINDNIVITKDFVYFNDTYAVTQNLYYWNQIYSYRKCPDNQSKCDNGKEIQGVCPAGYKLEHDSLEYNHYEKQLIWYYINKNRGKFFQHNSPKNIDSTRYIATPLWVWDRFDEHYARNADIQRIKNESKQKFFNTREFIFSNPGHTDYKLSKYNQYHYNSDQASHYIVWTKMPALCEKIDGKINTAKYQDKYKKSFAWINVVPQDLRIKNKHTLSGYPIMLSYAHLKLSWFFEWNKMYFQPFKKHKDELWLHFVSKDL